MDLQGSVESANRSAERQLTASAALPAQPRPAAAAKKTTTKKTKRKPILIITVDIGAGRAGDINVFEGDLEEDLARAFCETHALSLALVPAIAKHIENNVDALGQGALPAARQDNADEEEQQNHFDLTRLNHFIFVPPPSNNMCM